MIKELMKLLIEYGPEKFRECPEMLYNQVVLITVRVNQRTGLREMLGISTVLSEAEVHWRHFPERLQKMDLRTNILKL